MSRKHYTKEFKIQALELANQVGSMAEAGRQLGVRDSLLHVWKKKYDSGSQSKAGTAEVLTESAETRRLRKENEELKKVNYILKRAAAFFSQDHLK